MGFLLTVRELPEDLIGSYVDGWGSERPGYFYWAAFRPDGGQLNGGFAETSRWGITKARDAVRKHKRLPTGMEV